MKQGQYCTKGIILAGGSGSRLYPLTGAINKQLLPIYNKPMIYYPLTVLMLAGIRDILIICNPEDEGNYRKLLHDGSQWGISIQYKQQDKPRGIADAFIVGEEFINGQNVALILGDNIFYGRGISTLLKNSSARKEGATLFAYFVSDPQRYGVAEFNDKFELIGIEEKPQNPKSNFALTGLYFYDNTVCDKAKRVKPSKRGEIEITDLNLMYLEEKKAYLEVFDRGTAWLDTGTHSSMLEASMFVEIIEKRQGLLIASPEEVAQFKGYISDDELITLVDKLPNSSYKDALILTMQQKETSKVMSRRK